MSSTAVDLAIIGGGINGCGIARDAAGRGLSVALFERAGLASGTSSASTKLIHGGLRYLEQYQFGLVREALREREVLWQIAPHLIRPMRFVLPHHPGLRHAVMIRMGLWLYDHLAGRKLLRPSRRVRLAEDEVGAPLRRQSDLGFEYSDCWVDDARLVILNAVDAHERGASIHPYTEVVAAERTDDHWTLSVRDVHSGATRTWTARALINAAGPWVGEVAQRCLRMNLPVPMRLVKGSHIVVPKLFDHGKAYLFQAADKRVVFATPFEEDFTLIGTTESEYEGDPAEVHVTAGDVEYLCEVASENFQAPVRPDSVVWGYAGVRPLHDASRVSTREASRGYTLEREKGVPGGALVQVLGGKLTSYRQVAEKTVAGLADVFPELGRRWTHAVALPGGDFAIDGLQDLVRGLTASYPSLSPQHLGRLARSYGTRAGHIAERLAMAPSVDHRFGADLYHGEVEYLVENEWAHTAEDILWRHTKLGLRFTPHERERLGQWLAARPVGEANGPVSEVPA